jgi:glycosyltransferase involved in cell wall biosynthesis
VGHAYRFALGHRNLRVIFQNRDDRQVFVRLRLVEPRQTVLIKGSGVDPAVFAPAPVVHPNATPLVILASRLLWDKGVGEFVEAARLLRQEQVQARFILVGNTDPNPSSVPERTLQAWHASGVVEWWGHQARMRDVFAQADIACLPSYREGLPKVLIEAAASGLPIVTTDVPGCRDICKDGENGLLVPAANAGALADALRSLLHDPARRDVMGRRGRELFLKEFTLDRVVSQTLTVYRDLLKQPGQEAGL